jgi:hypothetical protein
MDHLPRTLDMPLMKGVALVQERWMTVCRLLRAQKVFFESIEFDSRSAPLISCFQGRAQGAHEGVVKRYKKLVEPKRLPEGPHHALVGRYPSLE